MARYRIHQRAAIQIAEIVARIAQESPRQASQVYWSFLSTFIRLGKNPLMARAYGDAGRFRRWSGTGKIQNFYIYYEVKESGIEILHVVHAARDQSAALEELE